MIRRSVAVALAVALGAAMNVTAQEKYIATMDETLRGLKGVGVAIRIIGTQAEPNGLRRDDVQTDVELKLRLAGIRVLSDAERLATPGSPLLLVTLNVMDDTPPLSGCALHIALSQDLASRVLPKTVMAGQTWAMGGPAIIGTMNLRKLREWVKDYVDKFINAWLTVNPTAPK